MHVPVRCPTQASRASFSNLLPSVKWSCGTRVHFHVIFLPRVAIGSVAKHFPFSASHGSRGLSGFSRGRATRIERRCPGPLHLPRGYPFHLPQPESLFHPSRTNNTHGVSSALEGPQRQHPADQGRPWTPRLDRDAGRITRRRISPGTSSAPILPARGRERRICSHSGSARQSD